MQNEFFHGFIRLHILYHASEESIFGLGILRELRRHGYELSPGTLYPLLHRMEKHGLLESRKELVAGKVRRVYVITKSGLSTLHEAREKVRELFGELFADNYVSIGQANSPRLQKRRGRSA
ncbi:MAG: PadR family transcriptional regulator [Thermodesulfobacteriota bacterium]